MNYVKTAVYILITCMVLSLVLTYASLMTIIGTSKDNTEKVLTSYVTENSIYIYNSIKNGHDFTHSLNAEYFSDRYLENHTLDFDENYLYNRNSEGGYVYKLTKPQTDFSTKNTLNLTCTYDLHIPVEFAGEKITDLIIPVEVSTSFNLK